MYAGAGGVARKARSAYIGDGDGKARLFCGPQWEPVITPDNMTSNTKPAPYVAKAKNINNAAEAYRAFETENNDCQGAQGSVAEGGDIPSNGDWWIEIDLREPKYANYGRLRLYEGSSEPVSPSSFQILGSNDPAARDITKGTDLWNVLGSVTDYAMYMTNTVYEWQDKVMLNNPDYYRYYRIRITRASATGLDPVW
jgi:hypothetical protein